MDHAVQELRPRRSRAVAAGVALALFAIAGVAATTLTACKRGHACWSSRYNSYANMAAFPGGASAGPKARATAEVARASSGGAPSARVALGGVDVVAYQTILAHAPNNASVAGVAEHAYTLRARDGVDPSNEFASTFYFASADHRARAADRPHAAADG